MLHILLASPGLPRVLSLRTAPWSLHSIYCSLSLLIEVHCNLQVHSCSTVKMQSTGEVGAIGAGSELHRIALCISKFSSEIPCTKVHRDVKTCTGCLAPWACRATFGSLPTSILQMAARQDVRAFWSYIRDKEQNTIICVWDVHVDLPLCESKATFRSLFWPVSMLLSCAFGPEKMLSSDTSAACGRLTAY